MAYTIDGKSVSKPWHVVLTHYRRKGGRFTVTSGRRTLAEQWRLYRAYKAGTGNLAAYPSPGAPHINYGRANHAIDVDALDGGADRMVRWLRGKGVAATRPVSGEPWHIQVPNDQLKRLAADIERKRKANAKPKLAQKVTAELIARLRHRAMRSPTKEERAYWKRALDRNRAKLGITPITTVSKQGAEFIAEFEGGASPDGKFRPYRDPVGVWTQGFGHTAGVKPGAKPWSKAKALRVLRADLDRVYAPPVANVAKQLGLRLDQREFDALVSAVFNLGPGILAEGRSLGQALRAKNWRTAVAGALLLYNKAGSPPQALPGLTRRRKAERRLFLGGTYR